VRERKAAKMMEARRTYWRRKLLENMSSVVRWCHNPRTRTVLLQVCLFSGSLIVPKG
jgi:hypothetical protein